MPEFIKQNVSNGEVITEDWGNHIQTQFDAVVGTSGADMTFIKALGINLDTRRVHFSSYDSDGNPTQINIYASQELETIMLGIILEWEDSLLKYARVYDMRGFYDTFNYVPLMAYNFTYNSDGILQEVNKTLL